MPKITRDSLMTLEAYSKVRLDFRAKVIEHKKPRTVHLGEHLTLIFEDELTMRYQVQEMLRVEKIFEEAGINDDLEAYNPLIPDGSNWKATMMIEYAEADERARMLAKLIGIENRVWVRIAGHTPVYAIADEDLDRTRDDKTSSVHFLRFELTAAMKQALQSGAALAMGVDHPAYRATLDPVPQPTLAALLVDIT
jgi:glycerol-3-phosphate dehydrogenase subunit C